MEIEATATLHISYEAGILVGMPKFYMIVRFIDPFKRFKKNVKVYKVIVQQDNESDNVFLNDVLCTLNDEKYIYHRVEMAVKEYFKDKVIDEDNYKKKQQIAEILKKPITVTVKVGKKHG